MPFWFVFSVDVNSIFDARKKWFSLLKCWCVLGKRDQRTRKCYKSNACLLDAVFCFCIVAYLTNDQQMTQEPKVLILMQFMHLNLLNWCGPSNLHTCKMHYCTIDIPGHRERNRNFLQKKRRTDFCGNCVLAIYVCFVGTFAVSFEWGLD